MNKYFKFNFVFLKSFWLIFQICIIFIPQRIYCDTIPNTIGNCQNLAKTAAVVDSVPWEFNIHFENDTIYFSGKMYHNCCGNHFLVSEIHNDTISLTRLDTGMICFCHCIYDFGIVIPNLKHDAYQFRLSKYYDNGLDTLIQKGIGSKSYSFPKRIRQNRFEIHQIKSKVIFSFSNKNEIFNIQVFDLFGNITKTFKAKNMEKLIWPAHDIRPGVYLIKINNGHYTNTSKVVIQ